MNNILNLNEYRDIKELRKFSEALFIQVNKLRKENYGLILINDQLVNEVQILKKYNEVLTELLRDKV